MIDPRGNTTRLLWQYDHQLGGVIGPDPDGSGPLKNRAQRFSYTNGRLWAIETGSTASQSDTDWANFTQLAQHSIYFDAQGRRIRDTAISSGAAQAVTDYSYDAADRVTCTAVRMNPGAFSASPGNACVLNATGGYGRDRIDYQVYDVADRVTASYDGFTGFVNGSPQGRKSFTATYTDDDLPQTQTDANGSTTAYTYTGLDQLFQVQFPNPSTGAVNSGDYEQYKYNENGAITQDRRRGGNVLTYGYDSDDHLGSISDSGGTLGYAFTYDNLGRILSETSGGQTVTSTYDALGRQITENSGVGLVKFQYDLSNNRTTITWPDNFGVVYHYDATNTLTDITEPQTVLAHYKYDDLARRIEVDHANSANSAYSSSQTYGYGSDLRLSVLNVFTGDGTRNESYGFAYNPAGQLRSSTSSNSLYDWTSATGNVTRGYAVDHLNRYSTSGGIALSYGGNGNTTNDTQMVFNYDSANKLTSLGNHATLSYDGLARLSQTTGSATTRFMYEGDTVIGEYDGSGSLLRRFVPGAAKDEFAAWYEGTGSAGRRYPISDRQGSVVAILNDAGGVLEIDSYDENGMPQLQTDGTPVNKSLQLGFNGALWVKDAGLYHMRAREYSPTLGRFMQTDPMGYADGLNFYNYAHSDSINGWDPTGFGDVAGVVVNAPQKLLPSENAPGNPPGKGGPVFGNGPGGGTPGVENSVTELVITFKRRPLSTEEKYFYASFGYPRKLLDDVELNLGIPAFVTRLTGPTDGFTPNRRSIYLKSIASALSGPGQAGLIGHELLHAWEFYTGVLNPAFYGISEFFNGYGGDPYETRANQWQRYVISGYCQHTSC